MHGFEPSLFDKLFDPSPTGATRRTLGLEQLKDSVARDLEALLNSRATSDLTADGAFPQAARSLVTFGLNDFAGMSLASVRDRERICAAIEQAIARHEPRLQEVSVKLELSRRSINALYFSIKALLVVRPAQEPVSFDAMLQPSTLQYSVGRRHPGRSD